MNIIELKSLIKQFDFKPQKNLGQNFLIDKNLRDKIINLSDITSEDIVLEVGAGFGALTEEIAKKAKKVFAVEIDNLLYSYLEEYLGDYENIELIKGDILNIDIPFHNKFISNIPYSITGPLLEVIFFKSNPPKGILTIEKNLADRIFFKGNYRNFSRLTLSVNSYMNPIEQTKISSNSFYPVPKIDISLIKLNPKEEMDPFLKEDKKKRFYLDFIAGIMPYKNKNIANAIELYFINKSTIDLSKEDIFRLLKNKNYENNKLINFKIEDLIDISKEFYNLCENN